LIAKAWRFWGETGAGSQRLDLRDSLGSKGRSALKKKWIFYRDFIISMSRNFADVPLNIETILLK